MSVSTRWRLGVVGLMMILLGPRRAMAQRWFAWTAGFSFLIYVLHVPTVNYVTALAFRFGKGLPYLSTLTYLLLPLLIVGAAVLLGAGLRRVAPGVYGVLTGGRGMM